MDDFLNIFLLTLAIGLSLAASIVSIKTFFPNRIQKTRRVLETMPGRSLALGLVNSLFLSIIILVFSALMENVSQIFVVPTLFFGLLMLVGLLNGLTATADLVGNRLFGEHTEVRRTAYATWVLYAACLLPFIGWFIFFGYLWCVGFGAAILGFFVKDPDAELALEATEDD
jgi:hypothetical protein